MALAKVVYRFGEAARAPVLILEQGRQVGGTGSDERVGADPDEPEAGGAVGLAIEQMASGAEQRLRHPARVGKAARTGAQAEIRGLQFEGDRAGCQTGLLQSRGDPL